MKRASDPSPPSPAPAAAEAPPPEAPAPAAPAAEALAEELDRYLPAAGQAAEAGAALLTGMRTARLVLVDKRNVEVLFAGERSPRRALLSEDVDHEVVLEALETGDRVLCEPDAEGRPVVVGVVRARRADTLRISARRIEIEGDEELLLRSGKSALRLREDGDVELVGSRISAASRGLFRLVGRMLRLN